MNKRQGNTFIIVIAVLGIIFYAASSFVASTIEEGRQTTMSIRGMHALSLAEAAIERTMTKLSEGINNVDPDKASSDGIKSGSDDKSDWHKTQIACKGQKRWFQHKR